MCDLINIAFFSFFLSSYAVHTLLPPASSRSLQLLLHLLLSPFKFTHSSLSSPPLSPLSPSGACPFTGTFEHSTAPWKQCLIWKLIKSVFLCVLLLLFSSQAWLSGWETAVTLPNEFAVCPMWAELKRQTAPCFTLLHFLQAWSLPWHETDTM